MPTQERGRRRVESILDAAAEVFAKSGFDAATIDAIAERAECSVGSIYRFFDNKQALFSAIAETCLERSAAVFASAVTPERMAAGWEALVEGFLDTYLEWERTDVRVRALYTNLQMYAAYEAKDAAMMSSLIDQSALLIATFAPSLKPKKRRLVATTVVNTATSFLFLARSASDREAKALLGETKLLLLRYLRPYVEAT